MGFLRRLFGAKKPGPPSDGSSSKSDKDNHKRRWSFGKHSSSRSKSIPPPPAPPSAVTHFDPSISLDANKHAIAVAAATAAVAEAALAAAHAAAEVVRLTSGTGAGSSSRSRAAARVGQLPWPEETAAVKIQSAFRSYLARRALRALKALVKLQALVRGHIVRKQTSDMLRRMQTLVRLQAQARASRAHLSDYNVHSFKSSLSHYPVPEEYEQPQRAYGTNFDGSSILKRCSSNANFRKIDSERAQFGSNWLDHWMEDNVCSQTGDAPSLKSGHPDDEKSAKILEVDTWKPRFNSHRSSSSFQTSHHYLSSDHNNENLMACESPSKRSTKALINQSLSSREVASARTADNSPQAFSASSRTGNGARKGPFTPTRSECSWGFFSGYSGYPNYMANTESFRAKVRSQSAPRQRLEFERYNSSSRSTRRPFKGLWEMVPNSDWDSDSRSNKVSPASSRLNRIGSSANLR